jgi:hypothetical protein
MSQRRRRRLLGLIIVLSAVVFLYPWKLVVVTPAIRVRVLDETGKPASGVVLKQKWEYRVIGSKEYQEISAADENGYAFFPERTQGNDDAILRWNRCVRLLQEILPGASEKRVDDIESSDGPPVNVSPFSTTVSE